MGLFTDCGCGIGRVVKHLLLKKFDQVDLLEQSKRLLGVSSKYIGSEKKRVRNLYCMGMQEFNPEEGVYDLIWCQWVMGHLTDSDFIVFLQKCKKVSVVVSKLNLSFAY